MDNNSAFISIVMPCYNEGRFIEKAILSLADGFCQKNCEIIVADGMSTDNTVNVLNSLIEKGLSIKILENKRRLQVFGLNLAIAEAKGDVIMRADAHCLYPPGYVQKCFELLKTTGAANVGGVMKPQGSTPVQRAIALAMQHPVGVGDAKFHLGNYSGFVDTVYLGTFKKSLFNEIGVYDANLHSNEDAELNLRILKAGKKIYLDSSIKVIYFPRDSFRALARQYFHYGRGRAYTTWKHKKMTSWRQAGPPVLVFVLILSIAFSLIKALFLVVPIAYFVSILVVSFSSRLPYFDDDELSEGTQHLLRKKKKMESFFSMNIRFLTAVAFSIMHISWGVGFLAGMTAVIFRRKMTLLGKLPGMTIC